MSLQTFNLSWGRQWDGSLIWHRVGQEIAGIFSKLLRGVLAREKDEVLLDEIEAAQRLASQMRMVPLPVGYLNRACPECRSNNLIGALLSPEADEADPNVFCRNCSWVN